MDDTKETVLDKEYEEYLAMMNKPTCSEELSSNNINVNDVKNTIGNIDYNKEIENNNNDAHKTQDNSLNKDFIKRECLSVTDTEINNNSYKKDFVTHDKSYLKEFESYLNRYSDKYDNHNTNVGDIPITSETEEFINFYKYLDFEQMLDSCNSYVNSENYLLGHGQNNETNEYIEDICNPSNMENKTAFEVDGINSFNETEVNIENYTYDIDDDFKCDTKKTDAVIEENNILIISSECTELLSIDTSAENTITSNIDFLKTYNVETELNCDSEAKKYNYNTIPNFNGDIKKADANCKEDNVILISSESELSIDDIQIDPSEHYSILNKMDLDIIDEFEPETDSDGYNSSDFEFIDEKDACLGGIINRTGCNINYEGIMGDNLNVIENRVNNEPGPSRIGYRLDGNTVSRLNSRNTSELEVEQLDHIIPEGEQLYELFAEPWAMFDFQAENKAFFSNKAMHLEADNIGFNVEMLHRRHEENEVDDAIKQEAIENARKIVTMYPAENTKRRRRRF